MTRKKFKQGIYKPQNPEKYYHSNTYMNEGSEYPIYRSSWELKFFKYCDLTPEIEKWSSEPFAIKYIHPQDNKVHRYYPDYLILRNGKKILVEIKPKCQAISPHSQYDKGQFAINQAKWNAAQEFCKANNMQFIVLTEKELGIGGQKRKIPRTQKIRSFT